MRLRNIILAVIIASASVAAYSYVHHGGMSQATAVRPHGLVVGEAKDAYSSTVLKDLE